MSPAFKRLLDKRQAVLDTQAKLLNSLSYKGVLSRGYALVLDADGQVARSAGKLENGDGVTLRLSDGDVGAVISDAPPQKQKKAGKAEAQKKLTMRRKACFDFFSVRSLICGPNKRTK